MRIERCSLQTVDANLSSEQKGVALRALSPQDVQLGHVVAVIDAAKVAVVSEKRVSGGEHVLPELFGQLLDILREEFGAAEIRASANDEDLKAWYERKLGLTVWHDIVQYERPVLEALPESRSDAVLRMFRPGDGEFIASFIESETPEQAVANLIALAESVPSRFAVATLEEKVVGYSLSLLKDGQGHFKSVEVAPACRRRGIGWDLCCDAIRWFEEHKVGSYLFTEIENPATHSLYPKLAYKSVSRTRILHRVLDPQRTGLNH